MKPLDFRLATWADLQDRLAGQRAAVLEAWRLHGPGTTEAVAQRAGISILTFRPRTTELVQLGFVALTAEQPARGEGTYRVRGHDELVHWFREQQALARGEGVQTELAIP
jgi:predicted ArsR family transcriptional regulator